MKWKLIHDDASHWHYEEVEEGCCEFWQEVKECQNAECIAFNGEPIRWHASFVCPSCRNEGVLISKEEDEKHE